MEYMIGLGRKQVTMELWITLLTLTIMILVICLSYVCWPMFCGSKNEKERLLDNRYRNRQSVINHLYNTKEEKDV